VLASGHAHEIRPAFPARPRFRPGPSTRRRTTHASGHRAHGLDVQIQSGSLLPPRESKNVRPFSAMPPTQRPPAGPNLAREARESAGSNWEWLGTLSPARMPPLGTETVPQGLGFVGSRGATLTPPRAHRHAPIRDTARCQGAPRMLADGGDEAERPRRQRQWERRAQRRGVSGVRLPLLPRTPGGW